MALNTFERLATVIHPADLTEIARRKKRLAQFLTGLRFVPLPGQPDLQDT